LQETHVLIADRNQLAGVPDERGDCAELQVRLNLENTIAAQLVYFAEVFSALGAKNNILQMTFKILFCCTSASHCYRLAVALSHLLLTGAVPGSQPAEDAATELGEAS
jgi:hypothetical protein